MGSPAAPPELGVRNLRAETSDGVSRITAGVGPQQIWFDSADLELEPAPEAFASALLPAAVQQGQRLHLTRPLDRRWRRGARRVIEVWADWWSIAPRLEDHLRAPRWLVPRPRGRRARGTGLCFSLGVDSFFTLATAPQRFDLLIVCEGFDVPLGNREQMDPMAAAVRAVAEGRGIEVAVLRTNLRRHRPVRGSGWGRTHGGPLAALGHACRSRIGTLVISSTHHRSTDEPWGSHWDTDPGWSSSRLRVVHYGERFRRLEKVRAIVDEPLAKRHLRVCWAPAAEGAGNCGECEKCVRTMLELHVSGARLAEWPFAGSGSLAERVERVPSCHPHQLPAYRDALPLVTDRRLRTAVEALMQRPSDPWQVRQQRLRRREARKSKGPGP